MTIDSGKDKFIRLYNDRGFVIEDLGLSNIKIKSIEREETFKLEDYLNKNTCLHCGKGEPGYCEDCYQELISKNAELQKEVRTLKNKIIGLKKEKKGIYEDYQDLGKEKLNLEEKNEELEANIKTLKKQKSSLKNENEKLERIIEDMADDLVDYFKYIDKDFSDVITYKVPTTADQVRAFYKEDK